MILSSARLIIIGASAIRVREYVNVRVRVVGSTTLVHVYTLVAAQTCVHYSDHTEHYTTSTAGLARNHVKSQIGLPQQPELSECA